MRVRIFALICFSFLYLQTSISQCEVDVLEVSPTFASCNNGILKVNSDVPGALSYTWTKLSDPLWSMQGKIIDNLEPDNYCLYIEFENCGYYTDCYELLCCGALDVNGLIGVPTLPFCDDGTIEISVGGGSGSYIFTWEKDGFYWSSDEDLSGLMPGEYSLIVQDELSCLNGRFIAVLPDCCPEIILPNEEVQGYYCESSKGGISFVNPVSGGLPPYTYFWSNGVNTLNNPDLSVGEYCLVVRDANNCLSEQKCFNVPDNSMKINVSDIRNQSVCEIPCDGLIDVNVDGGSGNFLYQWTSISGTYSSTNQDINGLCEDRYILQVTDVVTGCTYERSFDICCCNSLGDPTFWSCDDENGPLTYDYVIVPTFSGQSNGEIHLNISGGSGSAYVIWKSPASIEGRNDLVLDGLPPGTYCFDITDGCLTFTECIELSNCEDTEIDAQIIHTCPNRQNGSIMLDLSNFNIQSINWLSGYNGEMLDNLGAGTYTGDVVLENGCVIPISYDVIEDWNLVTTVQSHSYQVTTHIPACGDPVPLSLLVCEEIYMCKEEEVGRSSSNPDRVIGGPTAIGTCYSIDGCEDGTVQVNPSLPLDVAFNGSHSCPCCYEVRCPYWADGVVQQDVGSTLCEGSQALGNGLCRFIIKCVYTTQYGTDLSKICIYENTIEIIDDCGRFCGGDLKSDGNSLSKPQDLTYESQIKISPSLGNDGEFYVDFDNEKLLDIDNIRIFNSSGSRLSYSMTRSGSKVYCKPLDNIVQGVLLIRVLSGNDLIIGKYVCL